MNLAIQGHSTRGNEVIALLEMLGGKNPYGCNGLGTLCAYRIIDGNIQVVTIEDLFKSNKYILYSLEELLAKFPYKIEDVARLSRSNIAVSIKTMKWENDEIVYQLSCVDSGWWSVDNLKPYREKTMETAKITITPQIHWNEDKVELEVINDYEIKEENGKYYAVKKQFKYPKTYDECCKVLKIEYPYFKTEEDGISASTYKNKLIGAFKQLLICRDAYWKMAGEQMGLGKPWEPNWEDENGYVFCIVNKCNNIGLTCEWLKENYILSFPTEKMRDAFYENFRELIEKCKELL